MQSKLTKMKEGGRKLVAYRVWGRVTALRQGRSPVRFTFVFGQRLAVCLAQSQGPLGEEEEKKTTVQIQFILSRRGFNNHSKFTLQ